MAPPAAQWTEITPSQFPHEAEGLAIVKALLPASAAFRAWSNFEFRDGQGKWHEVDLLLLGRRRLHLVELKYYEGVLRGDDHRWLRAGRRAEDSPLKLARRKAQRLASRLREELISWAREHHQQIPDPRDVVPYLQEAVFLHHPRLRCELPPASRLDLFGLDDCSATSGLPGISERLLEPPTPDQAVRPRQGEILEALLAKIGVVQRREREAGSWVIEEEPLAEGDGWQDWPAVHRVAATDRARIRFFVTGPGAAKDERDRVRRLAEHEYRVMSRLAHDGLLRPRDLVEADLGVGLVYPRDEQLTRLDLWLAGRQAAGGGLGLAGGGSAQPVGPRPRLDGGDRARRRPVGRPGRPGGRPGPPLGRCVRRPGDPAREPVPPGAPARHRSTAAGLLVSDIAEAQAASRVLMVALGDAAEVEVLRRLDHPVTADTVTASHLRSTRPIWGVRRNQRRRPGSRIFMGARAAQRALSARSLRPPRIARPVERSRARRAAGPRPRRCLPHHRQRLGPARSPRMPPAGPLTAPRSRRKSTAESGRSR